MKRLTRRKLLSGWWLAAGLALTASWANAGETRIDAGLSGSFYDPAFNGQGINIEILATQPAAHRDKGELAGVALVYWYSFDALGLPFFSFGVGEIRGDTIEVDMLFDYDGGGPFFGPGWDNAQFAPKTFASAIIKAVDCDHLLFSFTPEDALAFPVHEMALERVTGVVGAPCGFAKTRPPTRPPVSAWHYLALDDTGPTWQSPARGRGASKTHYGDRAVTGLWLTDDEGQMIDDPVEGQELFFNATLTVSDDAPGTFIRVFIDGAVHCVLTYNDVAAGNSESRRCVNAWIPDAGTYSTIGRINYSQDTIDNHDTDSTNNELERIYVVSTADGGDDDDDGGNGGGFIANYLMSGSFYDPQFNGQGINTEVLVDQQVSASGKGVTPGIVLLYWYSYDSNGLPFFAFGVGEALDDTMTVEMLFDYDGNGPFFGPDWSGEQFAPVKFADVTIVWSGCNAGVMSVLLDAAWQALFEAHDLHLTRATAIEGLGC